MLSQTFRPEDLCFWLLIAYLVLLFSVQLDLDIPLAHINQENVQIASISFKMSSNIYSLLILINISATLSIKFLTNSRVFSAQRVADIVNIPIYVSFEIFLNFPGQPIALILSRGFSRLLSATLLSFQAQTKVARLSTTNVQKKGDCKPLLYCCPKQRGVLEVIRC